MSETPAAYKVGSVLTAAIPQPPMTTFFSASTVPASESEAERNRTDFSKHFRRYPKTLNKGE